MEIIELTKKQSAFYRHIVIPDNQPLKKVQRSNVPVRVLRNITPFFNDETATCNIEKGGKWTLLWLNDIPCTTHRSVVYQDLANDSIPLFYNERKNNKLFSSGFILAKSEVVFCLTDSEHRYWLHVGDVVTLTDNKTMLEKKLSSDITIVDYSTLAGANTHVWDDKIYTEE